MKQYSYLYLGDTMPKKKQDNNYNTVKPVATSKQLNTNYFLHTLLTENSRYLIIQSQQWEHQRNVWNLLKINNKIFNFGVFIINFKQIPYSILVFPLLTLNK